jgi:pleiotropic regulator 1
MEQLEEHNRVLKQALFGTLGVEDLFESNEEAERLRIKRKVLAEYAAVSKLPRHLEEKLQKANGAPKKIRAEKVNTRIELDGEDSTTRKLITAAVPKSGADEENTVVVRRPLGSTNSGLSNSLIERRNLYVQEKPQWHAPWKLMRVISGHLGWVRSVCVEPDNQWFATGSADRTIKIWDLASGELRLTLTGHIMAIRGLVVSPRHPYLFSAGEDKMVKCWDLEQNKVVRDYHGHLSGVYSIDLHPTLDLIVTAGRDAVARVWDIRSRTPVHVLSGHKSTISTVKCQEADPQVITGSMDSTVRLWDLAAGKTMAVLTHHKKSVRALAVHPTEFTFASASPDNIKEWKCPEGSFIHNFHPSQNSIVNTLSVNSDGVLFSGGDDGSMGFYDWKSGHRFQLMDTAALPGSITSEIAVYASTFDRTGLRLITCEADKSIKVWREDPDASPESHPLDWQPGLQSR